MKHKLISIIALAFACSAYADSPATVCIAGQANADGSLAVVSMNPAQIVVLQNGTATLYSLKDTFILFNAHYKLSQPFDMGWVSPLGKAGAFQSAESISAQWTYADNGSERDSASLSVDTTKLTGKLDTSSFNDGDGSWTGSTGDSLVCTTAGIRE